MSKKYVTIITHTLPIVVVGTLATKYRAELGGKVMKSIRLAIRMHPSRAL